MLDLAYAAQVKVACPEETVNLHAHGKLWVLIDSNTLYFVREDEERLIKRDNWWDIVFHGLCGDGH